MKRKILISAAAVMGIAAVLSGCGQAKDNSIQMIRQRAALNVAIPNVNTELLYYDEESGTYKGEEAELIEALAGALGVSVNYMPGEPDSFYTPLSNAMADVAIGKIDNDEVWIRDYAATISYEKGYIYVVTPYGLYAGDLSFFDGKTVGISSQIPSTSLGGMYSGGVTIDVKTDISGPSAAISAFESGMINGYLCYREEAQALAETGAYQIQDVRGIEPEEYVIAMPAEYTNLQQGVNQVIEQVKSAPVQETGEEQQQEEQQQ